MTTEMAILPAAAKTTSRRWWQVGIAASLLLTASPLALHAETSNAELAKEIAELKAQIRSLRGAVSETRSETRKVAKKSASTTTVYAPSPIANVPAGATPVFATADKKLIFGALTITPGGYIEANGFFRSRNLQSDVTSAYNSIPTNNNNLAHVNESRLSARQSRAALLIEAPISKSLIVAAYGEVDFNSVGTSSNFGQTNSFTPRLRNAYATLDSTDYGFHVLAGQNWSLVTTNSKGITPRNEVGPPVLDSGVLVGYDYARIPQIRIVKDFDKKLWIALSAESSQNTTNTGACGNTVTNTSAAAVANPTSIAANGNTGVASGTCVANGNGLGNTGVAQQFSINNVPDVIGKVAYEARFANRDIHLEALGIYKNAVSYVNYSGTPFAAAADPAAGFPFSTQHNATGGGVGAGILAEVIPKRLDFQFSGEYGRALGRYTSSGLPDATVDATGAIKPLLGASAEGGFIYHATSAFDLYTYAGFDQVNRNFSNINGAQVGYGAVGGVSNVGCNNIGGTCLGATHRVFELTGGFNDKLYKGAFGEVRVGVQYEYLQRQLFGSTANANGIPTAAAPIISARANEQILFTSLKYFPFQ